METRWLEDFLVLADTGSFTRSAELRHLTQPAFSRRIRALESWLGADLIDRTTYPTKLTAAGKLLREQAVPLLAQLNTTRTMLRGLQPLPQGTLEFAVPHTLSFSYFPKWLTAVEDGFGQLSCRLQASNVHDAVLAFVEGGSDFLMCYHHPKQPVELHDARYGGLRLGVERLRPYSIAADGAPMYALPGRPDAPLPFLGYASNAYFRLMSDLLLVSGPQPAHLSLRYETDMAEGLKQMALAGHGLAFLPESSVAAECAAGLLTVAGGDEWSVEMEVQLYCDHRRAKPEQEALWDYLSARYPTV
ncbi:LysR substrate-binding domain-containing protein [Chromobacterium amazonense]|uniref:LysR substrate-binding domain-containing protein n=1 Tax=Chromobacterium amazonense TaxID=1382803 RepID=A0ABU8V5X8_9NEIS|nr:LysR substrate-binding domain-containing protein [Chromobacterium amazonense]MDQ4538921.1 LysR substrate-binding domain-containing protein [Chromobacterium amazonense]